MKKKFKLTFVIIIVHDNISKKMPPYMLITFYVQVCINITEDGLSIDRKLQYKHKGVSDYIEFMFC